MKTKYLIFVSLFFCLGLKTASGQFVVADPALAGMTQANFLKDMEQTLKQFSVLQRSKDILVESVDLYKKVNSVIQNSKTVANILKRQGEMLSMAAQECSRKDFYSQKTYTQYTKRINDVMDESVINFDLLRSIISTSLSMTDGERLKIILDLDTKLKDSQDKLLDERRRFNTVNDAIKRLAALKNVK